MRSAEYKPLLFTTTVRNPRRMKALLWVLRQFDEQILTDELATKVVGELIRYGLYRPVNRNAAISAKWKSAPQGEFAEYALTDNEIAGVIQHNPQAHKEAGFACGFPSRFATIFDFAKELGFVYYAPNTAIEFSAIGKRLSEIFSVSITDDGKISVVENHPEYEQPAFLQALAKYQRNNPFVRVLNDNAPLILLLETIIKLNADKEFNNVGISRHELPLLLFWKDNNADALYRRIKKLRQEHGNNPSDEIIVDICVKEIIPGFKKFNPHSIISEYPDEFIRKMRLTGLISLRGGGRFIDINHLEDAKVKYVLARYSRYKHFTDERAYFDYMAEVDEKLFVISPKPVNAKQSEALLKNWLPIYVWDKIKTELTKLATRGMSTDEVLKLLPQPARLEFLTALAIKTKFPQVRVVPNYPCGDDGLPTSTAGGTGDQGDIECFEKTNGVLVEVTLAEGRTQTTMEAWPISRHLEAFTTKYKLPSQCVFIAPSIFRDSERQIRFIKSDENLTIRPYPITDFIMYLEKEARLYA